MPKPSRERKRQQQADAALVASLDQWSASPTGDLHEFRAAFARFHAKYPGWNSPGDNDRVTYLGTNGYEHFFQVHGDPTKYTVPVTEHWKQDPKWKRSR